MNYRKLGASGLSVSEIAFGNWITHGAQVDNDTAKACVHAALDAGITTFDTADVYSDTKAETVLGQVLKECGGKTSSCVPRSISLQE
ncbi:hypothetical protein GCM10010912_11140 [Paenibacillus albidus]|uniref:NADP-dependent oxidoreductase domain-containing protein n=1 Tax=Paenibacillus albidus TaxID=2041023 RepID=A0A917FBM1_9BACL|nr:hypothetical protein GCM10010912_11140 [Paenibacillus albidus]